MSKITAKPLQDFTPSTINEASREYLHGHLGIEILTIGDKTATGRMPIEIHHGAINGYLHAASVIALADTVCGVAAFAHLPQGATSFTTIELKSNHVGTLQEGVAFCTATAQHLGKNTQVWDAVVTDEATGKKIALFRCTQMVLWPKAE